MNNKFWQSLKSSLGVGILTIASLGILVFASITITRNQTGGGGATYRIYTIVKDSGGLSQGTAIRVAGIKIGTIDSIQLDQGQAKVGLNVNDDVILYANALVSIKSLGLLGDKYINITQGSNSHPVIQEGEFLRSLGNVSGIDLILENISGMVSDLRGITTTLNNSVGDNDDTSRLESIIKNFSSITSNLNTSLIAINRNIDSVVDNIDESLANTSQITGSLSSLLKENQNALNRTLRNLDIVAAGLGKSLPNIGDNLDNMLDENRLQLKNSLDNLESSSYQLNQSLENLSSITGKIDEGEGAVGKLVSDDDVAQKIEETVEGLNRFIGEANRAKVAIGFRAERLLNTSRSLTKGIVSFQYRPKREHYIVLQLVKNSGGYKRKSSTEWKEVETTNSSGVVENTSTRTVTITNDFLFSAQLAQRYYDTLLRVGLIENTLGFGIDQYFGRSDQVKATLELSDISTENNPYVRLFGSWRFFSNLHLVAGIDNMIGKTARDRFGFLGIELNFDEDSLKTIATTVGLSAIGN